MAKVKDAATDVQIHTGRREKLRQSYLKYGLASFNETQVLEYALGLVIPRIDTNPTAHRLTKTFGSLSGVIEAHPDKLREIPGIGDSAAIFLNFLKQFVTYYHNSIRNTKIRIRQPSQAVEYLREVMKTYSTEQFVLICLNKGGAIILEDTTTSGDLDKVEINLREIVDITMRVKSSSVLIAHNHLNNDVAPSDSDIILTRQLVNVLLPLGIDIFDHIIFGNEGAVYSFCENKILDIFKREHRGFVINKDYEDYWQTELTFKDEQ